MSMDCAGLSMMPDQISPELAGQIMSQIVWRDMATSRFRDRLIAEDRVISDLAERLLPGMKRKLAS
jgi:hypothetical protein